jgi:hypothetical protein
MQNSSIFYLHQMHVLAINYKQNQQKQQPRTTSNTALRTTHYELIQRTKPRDN